MRIGAVALLVAAVVGGVAFAQSRSDGAPSAGPAPQMIVQARTDEAQILQTRRDQVAANRARQRVMENSEAAKAATKARSAAKKAYSSEKKAIAKKKEKAEESGALVPYTGPVPDSCQEFSGTRETGCALMVAKGFGIDQFPCLEKLWDHESGWNPKAENKGSGAYGIPQALPGSKMASAGADWKTSAATQIKWGLGYIKGRYSTPCGAWGNFQRNGNY